MGRLTVLDSLVRRTSLSPFLRGTKGAGVFGLDAFCGGRLRARNVDCSPNRFAVCACHDASPNGGSGIILVNASCACGAPVPYPFSTFGTVEHQAAPQHWRSQWHARANEEREGIRRVVLSVLTRRAAASTDSARVGDLVQVWQVRGQGRQDERLKPQVGRRPVNGPGDQGGRGMGDERARPAGVNAGPKSRCAAEGPSTGLRPVGRSGCICHQGESWVRVRRRKAGCKHEWVHRQGAKMRRKTVADRRLLWLAASQWTRYRGQPRAATRAAPTVATCGAGVSSRREAKGVSVRRLL